MKRHENTPPVLFGVAFEDGDLYYGVCLNRYLMTVTDSADRLEKAIADMLDAHIEASEAVGREPFAGLSDAPAKYWALWLERSRRGVPAKFIEGRDRPIFQVLDAAA
jgi:hypothetical protein